MLGGLLVLALAAGAGALVWTRDDPGNVEGNSEGFVTTEAPPPAAVGAWPEYGYNNARTRANDTLRLAPPFTERWRYAANSLLEFPPVVADGRAVLGTNDGRAIALDAATGKERWATQLSGQMASSPAIAGDLAYFTTTRGRVVALGVADGVRRWTARIGTSSESSPLIVDGGVFVGTLDGEVVRLDAATGRVVWRARAAGDVKASLALAGPNVVVGDYAGTVSAYNRATGSVAWRTKSPGPRFRGSGRFYGGPAVAYGRIYIANINSRVLALQADTGRIAWVRALGDLVYSSAAVSERTVFVGSYDRKLYALDAVTGRVRWSADVGERISGSASVVGSHVYVSTLARGGRKGITFAFDVATGKETWRFPDGRYSPAVAVDDLMIIAGRQVLYGLAPA